MQQSHARLPGCYGEIYSTALAPLNAMHADTPNQLAGQQPDLRGPNVYINLVNSAITPKAGTAILSMLQTTPSVSRLALQLGSTAPRSAKPSEKGRT